MEGSDATRTPEVGFNTINYLLNELPFNKYEKFNRKLIYEKKAKKLWKSGQI
jgi:hypothetical protein